jgi:hypothetical protein
VSKKKTSLELPYLSEDFNYLYTKLNGCEYATKSRLAPRASSLNWQNILFQIRTHTFFKVILIDIFIQKTTMYSYHKYTLTYQKYKKKTNTSNSRFFKHAAGQDIFLLDWRQVLSYMI